MVNTPERSARGDGSHFHGAIALTSTKGVVPIALFVVLSPAFGWFWRRY